ncbi:MAG TPA: hypothetical protein PKB12_01260 [Elusimicrobiota bacterium]|jgi:uroporphyrinogen-III decarboxylase|nr:hypothetical protein [Elusimicrobiota bacterium]HMX42328.1 hypothetical protein [Elusimicrobiota bacterium]HMX93995.1 hypothetical protein [Elusimicrobiota bacterium]HMZ26936.1 hypothetical protein [Elusimicrobiota bacterium]HNA60320.1 hypothetical protein [Elusimicrobiota bacterium]
MGKVTKALMGMAVAAGAGAYFLYGKGAAKKRERVKGWMFKMKGDVLQTLEKLKTVNEEAYHRVVEKAAQRYKAVASVNKTELKGLVDDMKEAWNDIQKELNALK